MNDTIFHMALKGARLIYNKTFGKHYYEPNGVIKNADEANDLIYDLLSSGKPCMIARYGATELNSIVNYIGVKNAKYDVLGLIQGRPVQWWWNPGGVAQMKNWSGFFPPTFDNLSKFGEMSLEDSQLVDILGSWLQPEKIMEPYWSYGIRSVKLVFLEPWHSTRPWSRYLENKRVVVIHPFGDSIVDQYSRRMKLFSNPCVLPMFKSLRVIKAVQSLGGGDGSFKNWFDALDWMKNEMDKEPYDVAIIGCGAYGFPLAAHAKRTGHQGIHLGGATQLLFGITGNRWIKEYGMGDEYFSLLPPNAYKNLQNEYWIKPSLSETPKTAKNVEGGCYW